MLTIEVPEKEFWNPEIEMFITSKPTKITLEHSLISISKWERKWHKPFLHTENKTSEELIDYIKCMTITPNVDDLVYMCLSEENILSIKKYMDDPMTATWFSEKNKGKTREVITSEVIYYWMIKQQIPVKFEKWHLNSLLTLIRVCGEMNKPKEKMSQRELINRHRAINATRRRRKK